MTAYSVAERDSIRQAAAENGWEISLDDSAELHAVRAGGLVVFVGFGKRGGIVDTAFGRRGYRVTPAGRLPLVLSWLREFGARPSEVKRVRVVVDAAEVVPGDHMTNSMGKRVRIVDRSYDKNVRWHFLACTTLTGEPARNERIRAGQTVGVWREGEAS